MNSNAIDFATPDHRGPWIVDGPNGSETHPNRFAAFRAAVEHANALGRSVEFRDRSGCARNSAPPQTLSAGWAR